jgi:hypothetical protein
MLFFRSEEQVRSWCQANGVPVRPLVTLGLTGPFWDPQADTFG